MTLYKTARNRCNRVIGNTKHRHIFQNIESSSSSSIWKFIYNKYGYSAKVFLYNFGIYIAFVYKLMYVMFRNAFLVV